MNRVDHSPEELTPKRELHRRAKAIRENKSIKGIFVKRREIKLSQYAYDTTLILDGAKESLRGCPKTMDDFYEVTALKLNDRKTKPIWIGVNS